MNCANFLSYVVRSSCWWFHFWLLRSIRSSRLNEKKTNILQIVRIVDLCINQLWFDQSAHYIQTTYLSWQGDQTQAKQCEESKVNKNKKKVFRFVPCFHFRLKMVVAIVAFHDEAVRNGWTRRNSRTSAQTFWPISGRSRMNQMLNGDWKHSIGFKEENKNKKKRLKSIRVQRERECKT